MLYAVLCYNLESVTSTWSKAKDDAVMAKNAAVMRRFAVAGSLGPVVRLLLRLFPGEPEIMGLTALMLPARKPPTGGDRSALWPARIAAAVAGRHARSRCCGEQGAAPRRGARLDRTAGGAAGASPRPRQAALSRPWRSNPPIGGCRHRRNMAPSGR